MTFTLETLMFTINHTLHVGSDVESFWGCRKDYYLRGESEQKKTIIPQETPNKIFLKMDILHC